MPNGELQQVVETEFLRNVDGSASSALKKLPSILDAPDPDLLGVIMLFAAVQHVRVPGNKQMISMIYEAGATDMMEISFANVERATATMNKYASETSAELDVTPSLWSKR